MFLDAKPGRVYIPFAYILVARTHLMAQIRCKCCWAMSPQAEYPLPCNTEGSTVLWRTADTAAHHLISTTDAIHPKPSG